MEKGQRVLVRPQALPASVFPGKVVAAGRRAGFFKVMYYSYGVFFSEVFAAERLEAIDDFGAFYQPAVVAILEQHL
jgi:hypothetical protein